MELAAPDPPTSSPAVEPRRKHSKSHPKVRHPRGPTGWDVPGVCQENHGRSAPGGGGCKGSEGRHNVFCFVVWLVFDLCIYIKYIYIHIYLYLILWFVCRFVFVFRFLFCLFLFMRRQPWWGLGGGSQPLRMKRGIPWSRV